MSEHQQGSDYARWRQRSSYLEWKHKEKFEKDKDLTEQTRKLEDKCKRILKRQEETYENIILMETDLMQGRREEKITKGILKKLKSELQSYKEEIKN